MSVELDPGTVVERLTVWLAAKQPDWRGLTVAPIDVKVGSGFSAEIFYYEVVYGSDLRLQSSMMAALDARGDVLVPPWIGMEEDASILGAPFLVMGRVEGQAATQRPNYNLEGFLVAFSPEQRLQAWTNALEALSKIHAIDWRDGFQFLDRPDRGRPGLDQYLGYLVEWHRVAGKGRKMPIVDAAVEFVLKHRPRDAECAVLWGDPTPSNTMWRPDGTVAALIDWELAALGPPELDLAWWLYFDDLFSRRFGVTRLEGLPTRAQTIAIYERVSGRRTAHLDYYDIVAALRMALVAVGAFDRLVGKGLVPAENEALNDNLMTLYLAEKLGLPLPPLGADFRFFMSHLTPVREPEA
jgi:aminoglycoside phosphotransferase (APT) family kinase protein